ncbi:MAG: lipoprotein insertase outer membrane protein LolB [Myxococcota bacterium]
MSRVPAVGLALLLAACTMLPQRPVPRPLVPVAGERERLDGYVRRAVSDGESRSSIRLTGRLQLRSRSGSLRVREVVLAQRPARLRMESLDWLGQTRTLLVSDGEHYAFFDGRDLERGPVEDSLLLDRLGLDLGVREAVALLLAAPPPHLGRPLAVFARGEGRVARLDDHQLSFDARGRLLGIARLAGPSRAGWQVEYSDWGEVSGGRYPVHLAFFFPSTSVEVRLEVREVELNPPLEAALFELPERFGD